MKYHVSNGFYMRCIAVKRPGQLVSGCPIGANAHFEGRAGIAEDGGGPEARTENGKRFVNQISGFDDDDMFTSTSPTKKVSWFDKDGTRVTWRERMKSKKAETFTEQFTIEPNGRLHLSNIMATFRTAYGDVKGEIYFAIPPNRDVEKSIRSKLVVEEYGYSLKQNDGSKARLSEDDLQKILRFVESIDVEIQAHRIEQSLLKELGASHADLKKDEERAGLLKHMKMAREIAATSFDRLVESTEDERVFAACRSSVGGYGHWVVKRSTPTGTQTMTGKSLATLLAKNPSLGLKTDRYGNVLPFDAPEHRPLS